MAVIGISESGDYAIEQPKAEFINLLLLFSSTSENKFTIYLMLLIQLKQLFTELANNDAKMFYQPSSLIYHNMKISCS